MRYVFGVGSGGSSGGFGRQIGSGMESLMNIGVLVFRCRLG